MKINRDRGRNANHGVIITNDDDSAWKTTHRDRPERTKVQVSPAPSIVVPAPPEGGDQAPATFVVTVHKAPGAEEWADHARKQQALYDDEQRAEKALQAAQAEYDADDSVSLPLLKALRQATDAASRATEAARHPVPKPAGRTVAVPMVGVGFGCFAVPAVAAPAPELVPNVELEQRLVEQEIAEELAQEYWREEHARRAAVREAMLAEERAARPQRDRDVFTTPWTMVTTRSPRVTVVR